MRRNTYNLFDRAVRSLLGLALLATGSLHAATIEDIAFSSLPGDKTEIRFQFDSAPPDPSGYTIEQPARIVLDMPGVNSALAQKHHTLGIGNARRVSIVSTNDRTRAIVNLTQLVGYETTVDGNTLVMLVGADGTENSSTVAASSSAIGDSSEPVRNKFEGSTVADIDFRRGNGGEGRILIRLSNPKAPVDVRSEGDRVVIEIRNTDLPQDLRRRLDVTDFATPVQVVDAVQQGNHTRISIAASGSFDYLAYQADDLMSVDVTPLTEEEVQARDDLFKYSGEKLSLNFQDIEVRSVLQLIADFTDLNLVASDTVSGRITLRLKNVPWDQALELILKTKGLDQRQAGNVLLVAPAAEIAAREKLELENQKQIAELAPLRTEFFQISYASATELFNLFTMQNLGGGMGAGGVGGNRGRGAGGAGGGMNNGAAGIVSERGNVIVDERTNSIILTDTAERLEDFRRVIARLDVPVPQVLIEARIVAANTNFSKQLGIRWGGGAIKSNGASALKYGGSLETLSELQDIIVDGDGEITSPDDLLVDLGVQAPGASSFGVGFTGGGYILDLELSALQTDGNAEIVARPKVITADKSTAFIEPGVESPFQEASSSGATATAFKDAVLKLEVTPQITPDNRIIMDLNVKQDSVSQLTAGGVPAINTNEVETQVLVDNAQTVVLGGIFQTDKTIGTFKTPFLGDLPYVGKLFRRTTERDDKTELLIFVTPRILKDSISNR